MPRPKISSGKIPGGVITKAYRSYRARKACKAQCIEHHSRNNKRRKCLRRCKATMRPYRERVHYISD